jgi:hypothetical protein
MPAPDEQDEDEIEYGKWFERTAEEALAEARKALPPLKDIWPHWNNGVPTKLCRYGYGGSFHTGTVHHRDRLRSDTVELQWHGSHMLTELEGEPYRLPGHHSGVYRIFVPDIAIDRCCGKDKTGTLYIGLAGTGTQNWSTLRTRIQAIVNQDHHATASWKFNGALPRKLPWETLAIDWAYTEDRLNYKGKTIPGAFMAEGFLLSNYNDSFGELPPLNQKG